jgi:hypothetical protein
MLYREAIEGRREEAWRDMVPEPVVKVIEKNWETVTKFAKAEDATTRVMGMKFPRQGYR